MTDTLPLPDLTARLTQAPAYPGVVITGASLYGTLHPQWGQASGGSVVLISAVHFDLDGHKHTLKATPHVVSVLLGARSYDSAKKILHRHHVTKSNGAPLVTVIPEQFSAPPTLDALSAAQTCIDSRWTAARTRHRRYLVNAATSRVHTVTGIGLLLLALPLTVLMISTQNWQMLPLLFILISAGFCVATQTVTLPGVQARMQLRTYPQLGPNSTPRAQPDPDNPHRFILTWTERHLPVTNDTPGGPVALEDIRTHVLEDGRQRSLQALTAVHEAALALQAAHPDRPDVQARTQALLEQVDRARSAHRPPDPTDARLRDLERTAATELHYLRDLTDQTP